MAPRPQPAAGRGSRTRVAHQVSPLLAAAGSLIADASASLVTAGSRFRHSFEVATALVSPDPTQPRRIFADAELAGLAATMTEQGQLQPILLRRDPTSGERWIVVAGERRWRAARALGWPTLLAIEAGGDPEVATILENLQRVGLSPVEEANGLRRLIDAKHWSQDRAAEALGKTKGEISATLHILTLPPDVLERVLTSELPLSRNALVELSRLAGPVRQALLTRARPEGLTVQAIRAAVRSSNSERHLGAKPHALPDGRIAKGQPPATRKLDRRLIDAAIHEVETAIHEGVRLDANACGSLERLRGSVETLLRVAANLVPEVASQAAHRAPREPTEPPDR